MTFTTPAGSTVTTRTVRTHVLIGEQDGKGAWIERRSNSPAMLAAYRRRKGHSVAVRWYIGSVITGRIEAA